MQMCSQKFLMYTWKIGICVIHCLYYLLSPGDAGDAGP